MAIAAIICACDTPDPPPESGQPDSGTLPAAPIPPAAEDDQLNWKTEAWLGDLDGVIERRVIRALVTPNPMLYFLDGGTQRGASYDGLTRFKEFVNDTYGGKGLSVEMVFIPVSRDRLLPALQNGFGDIAAANLTITPEREKIVAFSDPIISDVREVLVTAKDVPLLNNTAELAGREVTARASSSYHESLLTLNRELVESGLEPVVIHAADENLEDADLLEMVNAGLISMAFVDSHKAAFWADVLDNLQIHDNVFIRDAGRIAWAFRRESPKLADAVNRFVKANKKGTLFGNLILKRYLKDNKWVRNPSTEAEMEKFRATIELFRKYADEYDFDWLLVAAQAYQESGLDQSVVSAAGAVGVMQVLPSTAADKNVNVQNIEQIANNIHAGTKYLRFLVERYFSDGELDELNRHLFAIASYNAGPARVAKLRREAADNDLDPNTWFNQVEIIASRRIGQETVRYVRNIYKYYIAYRMIVDRQQRVDTARAETG